MHACCFRRDGKGGNVFGLSEQKDLPTQEDRDSFETKCRNVCIKDHPDQTNFKKRLEYYFQQADKDHSNTIEREEFDTLVEYTAEDARRHGFVPSLQQLYDGDVQKIMDTRNKLFEDMKATAGPQKGQITMDSYKNWALDHVRSKVIDKLDTEKHMTEEEAREAATKLVKEYKGCVSSNSWDKSLEQFKDMFERASSQFKDSYGNEQSGLEFDRFNVMIEIFAETPRVLGLVPKMTNLYKSADEMLSARKSLFTKITGGQVHMTYDQFRKWLIAHLTEKVSKIKTDVIGRA